MADLGDGQAPWTRVENLLADLWALQVNMRADPGTESIDHPARAEMAAKALAAAKKALKAMFKKRKNAYAANREEVTR